MRIEAGQAARHGTRAGMVMVVRFRRAAERGLDAMPQPGECTWYDRPLNDREPLDFTMVAASNVFSFNMTGAGLIAAEDGRAQLYCEGAQEEGYCGVVRYILEGRLFIVNVDNDGHTMAVRSARFPPFGPLPSAQIQVQVLQGIGSSQIQMGTLPGGAAYRAYRFRPTGNDNVTVNVNIPGGRAVAYLTDREFNVMTHSDAMAFDAHAIAGARISYRMPAGPTRTMHIVFKERSGAPANFSLSMSIQAGSCDIGAEPYRSYQETDVVQCGGISIDCRDNEMIFSNACGCGCERPLP